MSAVDHISAARLAAFRILLAVERGRAHSDDLLHGKEVSALAPADRHLAMALVLGVLRWQILLDERIRPLLKHPNARLDAEVQIALRLGGFQLAFLDRIPAHAAIDESVELTKQAGHRFAAGMVNAVLRKLAAPRSPAPPAPRFDFSEETSGGPAEAHPAWMVERWTQSYGLEAAREICRHGQAQPPLTIRVESADAEDELAADASAENALTGAGVRMEPGRLLTAARTVISGDVTAALRAGRVRIQDEGSQLVGELAAVAGDKLDRKVKSIVDTCAAPGGKTLILAERVPDAHIVACEASARRHAELSKRMASYGARVECRLEDAAELNPDSEFDLALVDAPCSGTGTLGRNPEIRHRLKVEDLARQAERQRAILQAALRAVRPGGRVVYSTCSLEPEENEQLVAAVLKEMPDVRQISLAPQMDALEGKGILTAAGAEQLRKCVRADGSLLLLPAAVPTDGFFVAMMERIA